MSNKKLTADPPTSHFLWLYTGCTSERCILVSACRALTMAWWSSLLMTCCMKNIHEPTAFTIPTDTAKDFMANTIQQQLDNSTLVAPMGSTIAVKYENPWVPRSILHCFFLLLTSHVDLARFQPSARGCEYPPKTMRFFAALRPARGPCPGLWETIMLHQSMYHATSCWSLRSRNKNHANKPICFSATRSWQTP